MPRKIEDLHDHAQSYVDRVLETQRRFGYEPHVSDDAYEAAVERAAAGFAGLTSREDRPDEDAVPAGGVA